MLSRGPFQDPEQRVTCVLNSSLPRAGYCALLGQRVPEFQSVIGKLRAILEPTKGYAYSLCQLQLGRIRRIVRSTRAQQVTKISAAKGQARSTARPVGLSHLDHAPRFGSGIGTCGPLEKSWRHRPALATIAYNRHRFPVVAHEHALSFAQIGSKPDALADLELQHPDMRLHLPNHAQPLTILRFKSRSSASVS